MLRRIAVVLVVLACAAGVLAYQTRGPAESASGSRAFVPSPKFFLDFSPSFRTSIADVYYLTMVQYYGDNVKSGQLASMPALADLVTELSPHFQRPYEFGAFALIDAHRPDAGMILLERGFKANPTKWGFPALLGYFAHEYGPGTKAANARAAASWYRQASALPQSPPYLLRLAAVMSGKGHDIQKAVVLWGQVYAQGDKYSRKKAVDGLERILPPEKQARMKAAAPLYGTMPKSAFDDLVAALFARYVQ